MIDVVFHALVVPYSYLILMDRALALREWYLEAPADNEEVQMTRTTFDEVPPRDEREALDDKLERFMDAVPRPIAEGGEALVAYGKSRREQDALAQASDDPDKLLAAAIALQRDDWFDAATKSGADPNGTAIVDETDERKQLNRAIAAGRMDYVDRLLDLGAHINNPEKGLPLHTALGLRDNQEMIEQLLERGADINARGTKGQTAIVYTAQYGGSPEYIPLLINRGANWRMKDDEGYDAIGRALRRFRDGGMLRELLNEATRHSDFNINDRALLEQGGMSAELLPVLLEAGMSPNLQMGGGRRLLHVAAGNARTRQVEWLLAYGADPFIKDDDGHLPVDWAAYGDFDGRERQAFRDCEKMLQEAMRHKS